MGKLDPHRPSDLLNLVHRMEAIGGVYDFLPDSAAADGDPTQRSLRCCSSPTRPHPGSGTDQLPHQPGLADEPTQDTAPYRRTEKAEPGRGDDEGPAQPGGPPASTHRC